MADDWFFAKNGQQSGPVDFSVLQQMAAGGQIQPGDLVWKQGMATWTAAGMIPGIFPAAAAHSPPPPPPPPPGCGGQGTYPSPPLQGYPMPMPGQRSYARTARSSMVLSLIGLVFCIVGFGFITGTLGIIFGGMALSGMGRTGDYRGRGMAITGIVVGIIDVFGWWLRLSGHGHQFNFH